MNCNREDTLPFALRLVSVLWTLISPGLRCICHRGAKYRKEPGSLGKTSRSRKCKAKRWQVRNWPIIKKTHASIPEKKLRYHKKSTSLILEHRARPSQRIAIRCGVSYSQVCSLHDSTERRLLNLLYFAGIRIHARSKRFHTLHSVNPRAQMYAALVKYPHRVYPSNAWISLLHFY
jgi:hypothetical protein